MLCAETYTAALKDGVPSLHWNGVDESRILCALTSPHLPCTKIQPEALGITYSDVLADCCVKRHFFFGVGYKQVAPKSHALSATPSGAKGRVK